MARDTVQAVGRTKRAVSGRNMIWAGRGRRNPVAIERRREATALPHGYERNGASDLSGKALVMNGFCMRSTTPRHSATFLFFTASLVLAASCRSADSSR